MQMKFDKEMFLRHRFWILVGIAMVMSLGGILSLQFDAGADTVRDGLKKAITLLVNFKAQTNDETTKANDKNAKRAADLENGIWKTAFQSQQAIFADRKSTRLNSSHRL